jgi:hypothetical protein
MLLNLDFVSLIDNNDQAAEAHHDKGGQGTTIVAFFMKNFIKNPQNFFS